MANYNVKFNKDDSVVRHIIIGLLADLNNKVYFHRQLTQDERVEVDIPFYYAIAGDADFLKDNFLFLTRDGLRCEPDPVKADTNYDKVPRGIVNFTSLTIDSTKLVNKRTRGQYAKIDDNGSMQGYNAEFEMIPITIGIDVEIITSSQLDNFKVVEKIIKRLYKSNQYNIEVGDLNEGIYRLSSYYAMPDDYTQDRPVEFSFDSNEGYKVTFSLEINSFIPSFEWETERHVGNRMFNIWEQPTTTPEADFDRTSDDNPKRIIK
tara:strand:- start:1932 stop:2720 length:789 start_codon:yes stop_codon:yes gene_type:complete